MLVRKPGVNRIRKYERMPFWTNNRIRMLRWPGSRGALEMVFGAFLVLLCLAEHLSGQVVPPVASPPAKAETPAIVDPLGRETPRSSMMGLLKYEAREDFATAARYLQPPPGMETEMVRVATEIQALRRFYKGDIALLSDDPAGEVEPGLPLGKVRAGVVTLRATTAEVILVRVNDPEFGKIWLVSQETVARTPQLYAEMQREAPSAVERMIPSALINRRLLGMSLAQWLGWLLSIPFSMALAWLVPFVLGAPWRLRNRRRNPASRSIWETQLAMPLRCILAISIHCLFVYLLNPPLLYRFYYFRFMAALLVTCFAWLVSRGIDRGFENAVNRIRTQHGGGESFLVLMQRLTRVGMMIVAVVTALALFGVNVQAAVAGLGIGGLAIALAAQKTFENILGGISLLMDKAVQVGDFCAIGGKFGTVEDIGLRSLKLRTLDQNLLVVPNGALSQMQFENLKARPKLLIDQTFSLRIETPVPQLRSVLDRVQNLFTQHPSIEGESSTIRINRFAGAAFELQAFAYVKTSDWRKFTAIRQDVILQIAEIVESAGARFAAPTQLTYISSGRDAEAERAKAAGARD